MELLITFISKIYFYYGVSCGQVVGALGLTSLAIGLTKYLEVLYN